MIIKLKTPKRLKNIILLLFLITAGIHEIYPENLVPDEQTDQSGDTGLTKRTVAIMPVVNLKKIKQFDYLKNVIRLAFNNRLSQTDKFNTLELQVIDTKSKQFHFEDDDFLNNEKLGTLSVLLKSDIYLLTKYTIENEIITIFSEIYDVLSGEIILSKEISGNIGIEIYNYINTLVENINTGMENKIKKIQSSQLEALIKSQAIVVEEANYDVIDKLLIQKSNYQKITVDRNNERYYFAVPREKNVFIFINNKQTQFTIEINNKHYTSTTGIKILAFENNIGTEKRFTILNDNTNQKTHYTYNQKKENDIVIKHFFYQDRGIRIDTGMSITTLLYFCQDVKLSLLFPFNHSRENAAYARFSFGPGITLFKQANNTYIPWYPHFKFRWSLGYERLFMVTKLLTIHAGVDIGAELYLHRALQFTHTKTRYEFNTYQAAYPSLTLAFPVLFEFLPHKRIAVVAGIEPVLRILYNLHWIDFWGSDLPYDGKNDTSFEASRGLLYDSPLRIRSSLITIELFFYDMPIMIYARIKI